MRAINHAITGASLALIIQNPVLALPLAFLSHFVLDAIPHFDTKSIQPPAPIFSVILAIDAALCGLLVLLLGTTQPSHWIVAAIAAFLATSPDFMWMPRFVREQLHYPAKPFNPVMRFHSWIQWYQKPPGLIVEIAWFALSSTVLLHFL